MQIQNQVFAAWVAPSGLPVTGVVIPDGVGGFWKLIVDVLGNLGTISVPGPATADPVLADGSGGFWQVVVDSYGDRGAKPALPPSTTVILTDPMGGTWKVTVDPLGDLGTVFV